MNNSNLFNVSILFFFLILLTVFYSCSTSSHTTNNNTHLDPVTGKNTNPKDTSKTGNYTAVTNSDKVNNSNPGDTITWCDTLKQSEFRSIVVCFEKVGNNKIKADTVDVLEINKNAIYSVTEVDSSLNLKLAYKVVVMLPFMSKNFVPAPTKEIPSRSIKAVEFYEGVLIALDSLKSEGVSLFVDVFDTQKDSALVESLLLKRELQEADIIIGPVSSKNLRIVAEFAKNNKKTLISPFNSRSDLTTDNPYYIQVNPSFKVHSDLIVEHIHKIESDPELFRTPLETNMIILALQRDSSRIADLQSSYSAYKNDTAAHFAQLIRNTPTIDIEDIEPFLKKGKLNIILIPSYQDEGFIYNALREIQKLVDKVEPKKGHQIVIVGMDRWKYYNRINFEYFESMNLYLSSQYFTDINSDDVQKFKKDYKAVYGIGTREFGFIGFDMMLYFGRVINKYGTNFPAHLWKENAQYNHTKFQIEPSYEALVPLDADAGQEGQTILRNYENKFLNFLKFEDYKLQRVN
jgi:hypothetical protein